MRFVAFIAMIFLSGCQRFTQVQKNDISQYLAAIEAYNQKVSQMKASLDIKASGVMGSFIHERADIIVQSPHRIFWSFRSFFGPPSMILASNGSFITMYDFSGPHAYQKMPLTSDSFLEILEFQFYPQPLIDLMLAKFPLEGARNISFLRAGDKFKVEASFNRDWRMRSIFNYKAGRLLESHIYNDSLNISYYVKYTNFTLHGDIEFPHSLFLTAKSKQSFAKLTIEFLQLELNGAPVLPEFFYLSPQ